MSQVEARNLVVNDRTSLPAVENPMAASVAGEVNASLEIPIVVAQPVETTSDALIVTDLSQQLAIEGKRLRIRLGQAEQETFDALTMVPSQRSLAQIPSGLPLRETEGISQFEDKAYMPVPFLEKYVMPTKHLMSLVDSSMSEETSRTNFCHTLQSFQRHRCKRGSHSSRVTSHQGYIATSPPRQFNS
jgi:hypothetical protein